MKGNIVRDLQKEDFDIPEYNVEYKDEDINLCHLLSIGFNNGQFYDRLKKYIMFVKNEQSNITTGYEFFGNVAIAKMHKPEYRVALYQAISRYMMENKKYIGSIEQNENGEYYILSDAAQELAVMKYERVKEKLNYKKEKEGEER